MWYAVVTYRSLKGSCHLVRNLKELSELHGMIVDGPNIYAIETVTIKFLETDPSIYFEDDKGLKPCWESPISLPS